MVDANDKKEALYAALKQYEQVAIAFSAGVDSTFLLAAAREALGDRVLAITACGSNFPVSETLSAAEFCRERRIRHISQPFDPFSVPGFQNNPPDRCYRCKLALFYQLRETAAAHGFSILLDGTNADDDAADRPGMAAAVELGVKSPLREAGLTKAEIRTLSKEMHLPTWDLPAYACLATRFPVWESLTPGKLKAVERAEAILHDMGFRQCRVRVHGALARIAVDPADIPEIASPQNAETINNTLKTLGFQFVTLDLGGYRPGDSNNRKKADSPHRGEQLS